MRRCERRCEDEKVWEKMWRWEGVREDVKMRRCERRCEDEKVWRWEGVREDVKMRRCDERRCEDEKVWEKMWRWEGVREDVKMRRCERRCEDEKVGEKMWRWEGVREDVKMRRCERRCEDEKVGEKMWRWEGVREDVKMRRCERRCEDEKVWEKMWRWEGVKMRRWDTDPHYWKNPALRRSREKLQLNWVSFATVAGAFAVAGATAADPASMTESMHKLGKDQKVNTKTMHNTNRTTFQTTYTNDAFAVFAKFMRQTCSINAHSMQQQAIIHAKYMRNLSMAKSMQGQWNVQIWLKLNLSNVRNWSMYSNSVYEWNLHNLVYSYYARGKSIKQMQKNTKAQV